MKVLVNICIVLFFLFAQNQCVAQNGKIEIRVVKNYFSCDSLFMFADIEIKSNDDLTTFNVADLNIRMSYNRDAFYEGTMSNPSVVIEQELTLSGFVTGPGHSSFYDPHSLTGSLDTVISYNVAHAGGDGYPVDDSTWVPLGRIKLQVKNSNACSDIWVHDNTPINFPPTTTTEKFNGMFYVVDTGSYSGQQSCFPALCSQTAIDDLTTFDDRSLTVYPTLTSDQVTVAFEDGWNRDDNISVKLFSVLGKLITVDDISLSGNGHTYQTSLADLPQGAYFLSISNDGATYTERIIKQ